MNTTHEQSLPERPEPSAPSVVAIVVTHAPGADFDATMASLAAQDYHNLSVLVVDAEPETDLAPRIASLLPSAYLQTTPDNPGFARLANDAAEAVDGAAFFAFVHDDVIAEPDAIRKLVEEAYRSNAGIVGPKQVVWGAPNELLEVGLAMDKFATTAASVEYRELDQEQHDAVRDVFAVSGSLVLVRSDLFNAIGGFDPAIDYFGEVENLCWRTHLAGGRVVVVPAAKVQHRRALGERRTSQDNRRVQLRNRLRTMRTCYTTMSLVRVMPQAVLLSLAEIIVALVFARFDQVGDVIGAWGDVRRDRTDLRRQRALVQERREVPDVEIRRLQAGGSARISAYVRGQIGRTIAGQRSLAGIGRRAADAVQNPANRILVVGGVLIALITLFGSRHLLTRQIPAIGEFATFGSHPSDLLGQFTSGLRIAGLGGDESPPLAFGILGVGGWITLGSPALLRWLLILAAWPVGFYGAFSMARPIDSRRAQIAAVLVYAFLPLSYNAFATGSWTALTTWAVMPYLIARLGRASRTAPFVPDDPEDARSSSSSGFVAEFLGLGLLLGVVGAFVPVFVVFVAVVAACFAVGGVLTGDIRSSARMLGVAAGSLVVGAVLNLPWSLRLTELGANWAAPGGVGLGRTIELSLLDLVGFRTGPVGGALSLGFLLVSGLSLILASGWRFAWAVRCWVLLVGSWLVAFASAKGGLVDVSLDPTVALVPAGAAMAFATALGVNAFEVDLKGHRFGWRQVASGLAGLALLGALVPVLGSSFDGRWHAPRGDLNQTFVFLDQDSARTLWIGDASALPLAGWRVDGELAYGLSFGPPEIGDQFVPPESASSELVADAVSAVAAGSTSRFGRLVGPMAIEYVVLVNQRVPAPFSDTSVALPEGFEAQMDAQLDLEALSLNPAYRVYRNTAVSATRSLLPSEAAESVLTDTFDPGAVVSSGIAASATPVLPGGPTGGSGAVSEGLLVNAWADSENWQLAGVDGARSPAYGWASGWQVGPSEEAAALSYETPVLRWLTIAAQTVVWLGALVVLWLRRGVRSYAPVVVPQARPRRNDPTSSSEASSGPEGGAA